MWWRLERTPHVNGPLHVTLLANHPPPPFFYDVTWFMRGARLQGWTYEGRSASTPLPRFLSPSLAHKQKCMRTLSRVHQLRVMNHPCVIFHHCYEQNFCPHLLNELVSVNHCDISCILSNLHIVLACARSLCFINIFHLFSPIPMSVSTPSDHTSQQK